MRAVNLRHKAIREGRLVPHPIPCNLVLDERGIWVEAPWFNEVKPELDEQWFATATAHNPSHTDKDS